MMVVLILHGTHGLNLMKNTLSVERVFAEWFPGGVMQIKCPYCGSERVKKKDGEYVDWFRCGTLVNLDFRHSECRELEQKLQKELQEPIEDQLENE
jgi:hypothetical protein